MLRISWNLLLLLFYYYDFIKIVKIKVSGYKWNHYKNNPIYIPNLKNLSYSIPDNCLNKDTNVWPLPFSINKGSKRIQISSQLKFIPKKYSKTLELAFERYYPIIFPHKSSFKKGKNILSLVRIEVKNISESYPQLFMDESYVLQIDTSRILLKANTTYGCLRGLETLSQMIQFDFDKEEYFIDSCPWKIYDKPRFSHRGLMMDTSRHFLSLSHIKNLIDSMVYSKLNVLHWHMTDSPSFPLQIYSNPKLWNGSFNTYERYLQSDVNNIVEYARLRGIRVIVEFDMPGHVDSWCQEMPDICPISKNCQNILNVASLKTFQVIRDLLSEVTSNGEKFSGLFPDEFIHLGGDEVNLDCWNNDPEISKWLSNNNLTADDAYKYFVRKVASIALSLNRRPIQWVEVFEHFKNKLDKRTVIHIWKDKSTLREVVKAGYNAILSDSRNVYLDHLDITWESLYLDEPTEGIINEKEIDLILGGQAEMWGETVDGSDLENTVWPKTAAFAERYWSASEINSVNCAMNRLKYFRCLLLKRGISAAPVTNKLSRQAPSGPGSCFI